MDIIFNEELVEAFFIIGTIVVIGITWFGYVKDRFSSKLSMTVVSIFVVYLVAFFFYRLTTGSMERKMNAEAWYLPTAIAHGIVSLTAILLACYVFVLAQRSFRRGENYFRLHRKTALILVTLWPLALFSGFLLG